MSLQFAPLSTLATRSTGASTNPSWNKAAAFLEALHSERGVECLSREGRLVLRPHDAHLSPEHLAELSELEPDLLAFLEAERRTDPDAIPAPTQDSRFAPLSWGQKQMYRTMQVDGLTSNFHMSTAVRIQGPLDLDRLRQSVLAGIRRHPALLARFVLDAGCEDGVRQYFDLEREIECAILDWCGLEPASLASRLQAQIASFRESPFDLAEGPLVRAMLIQTAADDCHVLLTSHHLVTDDLSEGMLQDDIAALYRGGLVQSLPKHPSIDYAAFVHWQQAWLQSPAGLRQTAYWERRLQALPPLLPLPLDRARGGTIDNRCAAVMETLPAQTFAKLRSAAAKTRTTVFPALFATFAVLLWRLSLNERIPIATLVANRELEAFENVCGLFFNTIVPVLDIQPDQSFQSLLEQARDRIYEGLERQSVPFLFLVNRLDAIREPDGAPLTQAMFSYRSAPVQTLSLGPAAIEKNGDLDLGSAYDLRINAHEKSGQLQLVMQYKTSLIDKATARSWLKVYTSMLTGFAAAPHSRLRDVNQPDLDSAPYVQGDGIVLDPWLEPVAPGLAGELYRLSEAGRQSNDPLVPWREGWSLIRTGQWARRRAVGGLDIYAQTATPIEVNGQPVDALAVERELLCNRGIREAVVCLNEQGELLAYLVGERSEIQASELQRHLLARLPIHCVPKHLRLCPFIARHVGGLPDLDKLMRSGLDLLGQEPVPSASELNPRQAALLRIWSDTLRLPRLQLQDDFISVGGNSLSGALIVAATNRHFACKTSLRHLFEARTVLKFDAVLEGLLSAGGAAKPEA